MIFTTLENVKFLRGLTFAEFALINTTLIDIFFDPSVILFQISISPETLKNSPIGSRKSASANQFLLNALKSGKAKMQGAWIYLPKELR